MKRLLLFPFAFLFASLCFATNIIVSNAKELKDAINKAQPGDVIIMKNGEWKDVEIKFDSEGTETLPITLKAQTAGKVKLTGQSRLKLGGSYLVVEDLYFTEGFSGKDPVISYRTSKDKVANNCRVTNCVVDNYNNPGRMQENNWVLFYGKHNRLDHSSFRNKKNMGVLLAVILDDERSRENFHSIDHNYFGKRPPLASNTGEIIRVGVSQHCQFNSFTRITDNFFEQCDGEAEVISIKSSTNLVKGNLILESQGSIVLRHGDFNTVENNVILGNYKEGTGGIRVVNKGQWVVNNFLYGCRGIDFRSPLTVMNGIPNSPAHRYVQVTDAVIANNSFYNCSPVSFCDGSDEERTLPPDNVAFFNNLFYNDRDTAVYRTFDNLSGFWFSGNAVSPGITQGLVNGFEKQRLVAMNRKVAPFPVSVIKKAVIIPDSVSVIAKERLGHELPGAIGFSNIESFQAVYDNGKNKTGASWFNNNSSQKTEKVVSLRARNADELYAAITRKENVRVRLTGTSYTFDRPIEISKYVNLVGEKNTRINFSTADLDALFIIKGGGHLLLNNVWMNGEDVKTHNIVTTDTSGPSNHFNFGMSGCIVENLADANGCKNFFLAQKSTVADSIIIIASEFRNNEVDFFEMNKEKDDKGYYNAEKIDISHNKFENNRGIMLDIYRGGNDESTLGPNLSLTANFINNYQAGEGEVMINLTGVQRSRILENKIWNAGKGSTLLKYTDKVRAYHIFHDNLIESSGKIVLNDFVKPASNIIK